MKKIGNFFGEVKNEMKQTNWPSGKDLRRNSIIIFSVMIFFGVFFFLSDFVISTVLNIF